MEKVISVEEKIRRAEEIYNRRRENDIKYSTARVNVNNNKDFKLLKKMFLQIIICLLIYSIFYICIKDNNIISNDLKNKVTQILNYDIDFIKIYNSILDNMKINENKDLEKNIGGCLDESSQVIEMKENEQIQNQQQNQQNNEQQNQQQNQEQNGAQQNNQLQNQSENENQGANQKNVNSENINENTVNKISQMEQDALDIKKNINFIIPVKGTITSTFGWRNPTTSTVPRYHTGLDIAAKTGTKIKSSTYGKVILNSDKGDFGKHLKIQEGDVVIIYAHCNKLYVKEGENVVQGQEIAEVGSTGNSTGPHLHFEIRKQDRYVDPQLVLQI